jgi:predicted ATPase
MLQEFRVDNFKSLINLTFRPREVNLLMGLNNAGKTNLCHAMRFLSGTTRSSLDECADQTTGTRFTLTNSYFAKPTIDFQVRASVPFEDEALSFDYRLTILAKKADSSSSALEVDSEILLVTGRGFENVPLLQNTRDGVRLLHEIDYARGKRNYVETAAPREITMLNRLYDLKTNARANCFKKYLFLWQYYELVTPALRSTHHQPNQVILNADGSNLASVVYQLKTSNERSYRKLLEVLRKVDPKIDVINFYVPSENTVFMFFEDSHGNSLPTVSISGGTLRFLALYYILAAQPIFGPAPLRIVEEPENGLYVGYLKGLLEVAESVESRPQLVFTSHSPYFIDLFDDRLDSIFLLKRGDQHSSITQPDVEQVKKRLEKFPLGEQHFREMLG